MTQIIPLPVYNEDKMESMFGTSPQSITGQHFRGREKEGDNENGLISLTEFIEMLPGVIGQSRRLVGKGVVAYGSNDDPITELFQ